METRIRELESELDAENRRLADAQKNLRRSERRITELTFQQDEDRKNHERMQVRDVKLCDTVPLTSDPDPQVLTLLFVYRIELIVKHT